MTNNPSNPVLFIKRNPGVSTSDLAKHLKMTPRHIRSIRESLDLNHTIKSRILHKIADKTSITNPISPIHACCYHLGLPHASKVLTKLTGILVTYQFLYYYAYTVPKFNIEHPPIKTTTQKLKILCNQTKGLKFYVPYFENA